MFEVNLGGCLPTPQQLTRVSDALMSESTPVRARDLAHSLGMEFALVQSCLQELKGSKLAKYDRRSGWETTLRRPTLRPSPKSEDPDPTVISSLGDSTSGQVDWREQARRVAPLLSRPGGATGAELLRAVDIYPRTLAEFTRYLVSNGIATERAGIYIATGSRLGGALPPPPVEQRPDPDLRTLPESIDEVSLSKPQRRGAAVVARDLVERWVRNLSPEHGLSGYDLAALRELMADAIRERDSA